MRSFRFPAWLALTALMASALLTGQTPAPAANQYSINDNFTASSGETLTVQMPANASRTWNGIWLTVSLNSSSAGATVCFIQNGTAATTTAATPNQLFGATIPVTKAFTASNSSSGTTYSCAIFTGSQSFNMSNAFMPRLKTTVQNLSISVTPLTGTITGYTSLLWSEN